MSSFRKLITVLRYNSSPELLANGTYMYPTPQEFKVLASVQPLKANEMMLLSEGSRTARAVKIYTDKELFVDDQRTNAMADHFKWRGKLFEVVASDIFQSDVINHYRAYAVEVSEF